MEKGEWGVKIFPMSKGLVYLLYLIKSEIWERKSVKERRERKNGVRWDVNVGKRMMICFLRFFIFALPGWVHFAAVHWLFQVRTGD